MSRSGYDDDCDGWALVRWRGAVSSAMRGARGQALMRDLLGALDAMPEKRLIAESLEAGGEVCALGCLGRTKGIDVSQLNPENAEAVARTFDIAPALAREIVFVNDNRWRETEEQRWIRMRAWVARKIHAAQ